MRGANNEHQIGTLVSSSIEPCYSPSEAS